jgi:hypothetical protein
VRGQSTHHIQAASRLDGFNPNKLPPVIEWATYVPGRRTDSAFKMHKRKSDALSAVSTESILYHYDHSSRQWIEVYREDGLGPAQCELCHKGIDRRNHARVWQHQIKAHLIIDGLLRRVHLCRDCKYKAKK